MNEEIWFPLMVGVFLCYMFYICVIKRPGGDDDGFV